MRPTVGGDVVQEDREVSLEAAGVDGVARTVVLLYPALYRGCGGRGGGPQGLQGDNGCLGH